MKVKTIIPASDVRPDEPRWWCVDYEQAVADFDGTEQHHLHIDPPADVDMPVDPKWAIVCREPSPTDPTDLTAPARDDARERLWTSVYVASASNGCARFMCVEHADYAVERFDERFRKEAP